MVLIKKTKKPAGVVYNRFEARDFSKKLGQARNYKRPSIPLPEHAIAKFLKRIGLGSWWARLTVIVGVALVVYVVYFAPLFMVTQIVIEGGDSTQQDRVRVLSEDFLKTRGFLFVRQNTLLTLSRKSLKEYLQSHDASLKEPLTVQKNYPGRIVIHASFKNEKFLLTDGHATYIYFDDGTLSRTVSETYRTFFESTNSGLIKVWWQGSKGSDHRPAVPSESLVNILHLQDAFHPLEKTSIDFYVTGMKVFEDATQSGESMDLRVQAVHDELSPSDIAVYVRLTGVDKDHYPGGYKIYFDPHTDIPEIAARAEILLSKQPIDKINNLYYIDMRYQDRAFMCAKGSVCSTSDAPKVLIPPGSEQEENLDVLPPSQQSQVRGATKP